MFGQLRAQRAKEKREALSQQSANQSGSSNPYGKLTPLGGGYNLAQIENPYEMVQAGLYNPEQQKLFSQRINALGSDSYTSRLASGDESAFAEMEEPALRQFSELQGGMASRFSGMGQGATRSSGFQNTMNQAGMDFASQLRSNRNSLRQQAIRDLHGMSQDLLGQRTYENHMTHPYENLVMEPNSDPDVDPKTGKRKKKSFWQDVMHYGAPVVGGLVGSFAGPLGAGVGAKAGEWAGNKLFGT